ncbi:MAG: hypothetical protein R6X33_16710 [Candidatus Brocadiia bacterium]
MRNGTMECTECGAVLVVHDNQLGKLGECPRCGATREITEEMFAEAAPEEPAAKAITSPVVPAVDYVLKKLRFLAGLTERFEIYQTVLAQLGLICILLASAAVLVRFTVGAIQNDSMSLFLQGLGGAIVGVALHYLAARFAVAGRATLQNNPQRVSLIPFLDCMGLAGLLAAVGMVAAGIGAALQQGSVIALIAPVLAAIVLAHVMVIFLNPAETMYVQRGLRGAVAGEAAVSILAVVFRCALVLAPVLLMLGALVGTSWMVLAMVLDWSGMATGDIGFMRGAGLVVSAALAPFAFYLAFMTFMLLADLYEAVLRAARR